MWRSASHHLCSAGSAGSSSQLQLGGAEEQLLDEQGGWFLGNSQFIRGSNLLLLAVKSINIEFCWWHLYCDLIM